MAKPQQIQKLRSGKLLTAANFPQFTDTFNYFGDFIENLKGDGDLRPDGYITVDTSVPDHPVVRWRNPNDSLSSDVVGDVQLSALQLSSITTAQLSGQQYIQLYNFDQTPTLSARATLGNNGEYEVGSGDWFLVKNGKELQYKKIVLSTDISGGGGGGSLSVDNVSLSVNGDDEACIKGWTEDDTESVPNSQLSGYGFVARNDYTQELKYLSLSAVNKTSGAFSYDPETHIIKDGIYLRARSWMMVGNVEVTTSGYAFLSVSMSHSGTYPYAQIVFGQSEIPSPTSAVMCIPLYRFDANLNIINDYRGAPTAQMWEWDL